MKWGDAHEEEYTELQLRKKKKVKVAVEIGHDGCAMLLPFRQEGAFKMEGSRQQFPIFFCPMPIPQRSGFPPRLPHLCSGTFQPPRHLAASLFFLPRTCFSSFPEQLSLGPVNGFNVDN